MSIVRINLFTVNAIKSYLASIEPEVPKGGYNLPNEHFISFGVKHGIDAINWMLREGKMWVPRTGLKWDKFNPYADIYPTHGASTIETVEFNRIDRQTVELIVMKLEKEAHNLGQETDSTMYYFEYSWAMYELAKKVRERFIQRPPN